jgi:toxin ParE1/3/4
MPQNNRIWKLTRAAEADLAAIWDYTAIQWSVKQADQYHEDIMDVIQDVAAAKKTGRKIDALRTGYLYRPCGSHNIFFRQEVGCIIIVRILHNRMDPARHL